MENKEEILEEIIQEEILQEEDNLLSQEELTKQEQRLYEEILQSGLLYTKKGREKLGIKLQPYKREGSKIERNSPCICGSGKKYKNCCLYV